MDNRASQMAGADYIELEHGEILPEPYEPNMPHLRGGDAAAQSYGINGNAGQWNASSANASATAYERVQPAAAEHVGADFYEVPAKDFYAARSSRGNRGQRNKAGKARVQVDECFDFNDQQQPNPWQNAAPQPEPQEQRQPQLARERQREREREPLSDAHVDFEVMIPQKRCCIY